VSSRLGQWYEEDGWWIRHDKTTKSSARLRIDAVKALQWGLSGLFSKPEWKDPNTLRITSGFGPELFDIAEGFVFSNWNRAGLLASFASNGLS
jgi:hypothetical protein